MFVAKSSTSSTNSWAEFCFPLHTDCGILLLHFNGYWCSYESKIMHNAYVNHELFIKRDIVYNSSFDFIAMCALWCYDEGMKTLYFSMGLHSAPWDCVLRLLPKWCFSSHCVLINHYACLLVKSPETETWLGFISWHNFARVCIYKASRVWALLLRCFVNMGTGLHILYTIRIRKGCICVFVHILINSKPLLPKWISP